MGLRCWYCLEGSICSVWILDEILHLSLESYYATETPWVYCPRHSGQLTRFPQEMCRRLAFFLSKYIDCMSSSFLLASAGILEQPPVKWGASSSSVWQSKSVVSIFCLVKGDCWPIMNICQWGAGLGWCLLPLQKACLGPWLLTIEQVCLVDIQNVCQVH